MSKETEINQLNIFQRIRNVMLDVKYIQRESKKVNNQYTFVSHDAVSAALHEPLARNGIVMLPDVTSYNLDGNRTTVQLQVSFVNVDNPADRFVVNSYGIGIDPSDKGYGKAVSYAIKYALLKTFCLETGDDVEKDDYKYQPQTINDNQLFEISRILNGDVSLKENLLKWLNVKNLTEVPADRYNQIIDALKKKTEVKEVKNDN